MNILIVGNGFAGGLLAWFLAKENVKITIIDRGEPNSSTRVSAGIMLPVTGRRLVKTQNADKVIPFAIQTYLEIEKHSGLQFYYPKDVLQIFSSDGNRNDWYARSNELDLDGYAGAILKKIEIHNSVLNHYGGIVLKKSGSVNPVELISAINKCVTNNVKFISGVFSFDDVTYSAKTINWNGESFSHIILCQGYESTLNPFTGWIPFKPVKGEIIDFTANDLYDGNIICNSNYILPCGNGMFRTGSTYEWNELDTIPTPKAKEVLIQALNEAITCPYTVIGHMAGIRPAVIDRRPVIGFHPQYKQIVVFNGLGTKGAMQGPYYSKQACDLILSGKNVDTDVDLKRFGKLWKAL